MFAETGVASGEHGHFSTDGNLRIRGLLEVANQAEQRNTSVNVLGVAVETIGGSDMLHFYRDEASDRIVLPSATTKANMIREADRRIGSRVRKSRDNGAFSNQIGSRRLRRIVDTEHIQNQFTASGVNMEVRRVLPFTHEATEPVDDCGVTIVAVGNRSDDSKIDEVHDGLITDFESVENVIAELELYNNEDVDVPDGALDWSLMSSAVTLGLAYGSETKYSVYAKIVEARKRARRQLNAAHS